MQSEIPQSSGATDSRNDGTARLSDAELICEWMERRPAPNTHGGTHRSSGNWWYWGGEWEPRKLTLDALHEVEARLTDEQISEYDALLRAELDGEIGVDAYTWHAETGVKTAALAAVLRKEVETTHAE